MALKPYPDKWKCTQLVPVEPTTLGDRLRQRRLELHLFQSDLAELFGVTAETIRNWEKNAHPPAKRFAEQIVGWLEYDPLMTASTIVNPTDHAYICQSCES